MQISSRLFRFITIIVLTVCGILSLIFLELISLPAQPSTFPIPEDARFVVSVDARELAMEDFKHIVFSDNDARLVQDMMARLKKRRGDDETRLSVDILHRIVFYTLERDGKQYLVTSFYVSDRETFEAGAQDLENISVAIKDDVALLVSPLNPSLKIRKSFAQNLLNSPLTDFKPTSRDGVISVASGKKSPALPGLKASIKIEKHNLSATGTFLRKEVFTSQKSIRHKGLFIHTTVLPQRFLDGLSAQFKLVKLKIPAVQYVDLDYQGVLIDNTDGIKPLPRVNAVIGSKTAINITEILAEIPEKYKLGDTVLFEGMTYIFKQLDEKTIFFGVDPSSIIDHSSSDLICVEGRLDKLLQIQASPMILSVVEIMAPQLRPSREFAAATESIYFCAGRNGGNKVEAKIRFKQEKSAYVELTRLIIGLQAIND